MTRPFSLPPAFDLALGLRASEEAVLFEAAFPAAIAASLSPLAPAATLYRGRTLSVRTAPPFASNLRPMC